MSFPWGRTIFSITAVTALLVLRFVSAAPHDGSRGFVKEQRSLMGTLWNIEVADHGRSDEARLAIDRAYSELARIDRLMSEWRPDSPISQVNAAAGQHAVRVPAELRELLQRSIHYSEITEGTFDVTWRGMGAIWHFDDQFQVPSAAAVAAARRNIDYRAIQITGDSIYIPKGVNIGLGGIAKGYAIDRAAQILSKSGFFESLIDGGGDVLVSGRPGGRDWRLGIQDPRREHGEIVGVADVSGMALVTSGDYERFRIVNGIRYHHIIDPRTGWPANASISVSVMSHSAEQGVVLAKGIFILGPTRGLDLARRAGVEAMLIDPQQRQYFTSGFRCAFHAN